MGQEAESGLSTTGPQVAAEALADLHFLKGSSELAVPRVEAARWMAIVSRVAVQLSRRFT
jgi:hypothetical protein